MKRLYSCLAVTVFLTACRTTPEIPASVSAEGMNYIRIARSFGVTRTSTFMYLPGEGVQAATTSKYICASDPAYRVTLVKHGSLRESLTSYCDAAVGSLKYVSSIYPDRPVSIFLHVVPQSGGFRANQTSWSVSNPRLSVVVPEFSSERRTFANVVDLLAHEVFHLAGALSGDGRAESESTAYWVGLCAQFSVLTEIGVESLPGDQLVSTDRAITESSHAAMDVRSVVAPLMIGGRVSSGSKEGDRLATYCQTNVPGQFKRK